MTMRIERSLRRGFTVFVLSGRFDAEYISELEELFGPPTDYSGIVVDLSEVRLADRAAVRFLGRCEGSGVTLENCPDYIREWITGENPQFNEQERMDENED
jgi:hypothetical protein